MIEHLDGSFVSVAPMHVGMPKLEIDPLLADKCFQCCRNLVAGILETRFWVALYEVGVHGLKVMYSIVVVPDIFRFG